MSTHAPDPSRQLFAHVKTWARDYRHDFMGTEHILLGLLELPREDLGDVLACCGVDPDRLRDTVRSLMTAGSADVGMGQLPFTPGAKTVLEQSLACAKRLGHARLAPAHLFLGLLAEGKGVAATALGKHGLDLAKAEAVLAAMWPPDPGERECE